ncbi:hypothetical protein [Halorussus ruber]|uniref:hypothetical protein n=1 Tax=Halorussus ruber TaxID=1126238 RepID=UPI00109208CE|nr:hypothetical protein [Halorussus ruber]
MAGCLGQLDRDDTVEVSNESDQTHTLTVRFTDENTGSVVSERTLTLKSGAERRYEVTLPDAGDESSHYALTVTTESGLRKIHDLGEGVFYVLYVTVDSDGLRVLQTTR